MSKLIKAFFLTTILSVCVFAQSGSGEYKRNEFYGGYSNQQVDNFDRQTFNGFEAAYVRNIRRYVGIKGDFSAAYRRDDFSSPVFAGSGTSTGTIRGENNRSLYNFLGGVQVKDNATEARFKPFAHALAGVAHSRFTTKNITCTGSACSSIVTSDFTFSDTGFSTVLGGGLDIRISDRVDFRAIQVDYNPIRANGRWNNNVRFGIGFVFK